MDEQLDINSLYKYFDFWWDCIIVEIVPIGKVFYAEWVEELISNKAELPLKKKFFITEDFNPIEDIFRIKNGVLEKYKKKTEMIMDALRID